MKPDLLTASYIALRDKLHRSAMTFLRNEEDAHDALQDTFFRLWDNAEIQSETEARNKLFIVHRNICIDRLRRPKMANFDEIQTEGLTVPPHSGEDLTKLENLLYQGLSPIQIKIQALHNEGMEYEEIALRLDMTPGAVRTNLCRARQKMRENYRNLDK